MKDHGLVQFIDQLTTQQFVDYLCIYPKDQSSYVSKQGDCFDQLKLFGVFLAILDFLS